MIYRKQFSSFLRFPFHTCRSVEVSSATECQLSTDENEKCLSMKGIDEEKSVKKKILFKAVIETLSSTAKQSEGTRKCFFLCPAQGHTHLERIMKMKKPMVESTIAQLALFGCVVNFVRNFIGNLFVVGYCAVCTCGQ